MSHVINSNQGCDAVLGRMPGMKWTPKGANGRRTSRAESVALGLTSVAPLGVRSSSV